MIEISPVFHQNGIADNLKEVRLSNDVVGENFT